jgi:hypothetical protein
MSRKILMTFAAVLVGLFVLTPEWAAWAGVRQEGSVWIVDDAEGFAPVRNGNRGAARSEARRAAQRDAIERAMGASVSGVTVMENYEVVKDKVFSRAEGIVKKFEIVREKVDQDGLLTLVARCEVGAEALDGVLGPVMIDAIGNPRVMVLVAETIREGQGEKQPFLSATEAAAVEVFEKAGYQIVDSDQARALLNIDLTNAYNDPGRLADAARTLNADVIVVGRAYGSPHTPKPVRVSGQSLWGLTSNVQLKAVLTDTAYQIGSGAVEKKTRGLSIESGVVQGFKAAAPEAARSVVYKAAYALAGLGLGGGVPGITAKLKITDVPSLEAVESIEEFLRERVGNSGGVYRRRFENHAADIDVVSEKNAVNIASVLSEAGVEVDSTRFQVISGRYTGNVVKAEVSAPRLTVRVTEIPSFEEANAIEDAILKSVGETAKVDMEYRDGVLEARLATDGNVRDIALLLEKAGVKITRQAARNVDGKSSAAERSPGERADD